MAHKELKKQFEKDRKIHGDDAFRLWEYQDYGCFVWEPCWQEPSWHPFNNYRRKEPSFVPEYFSGLNWREAEKLVMRKVDASLYGEEWRSNVLLLGLNKDPYIHNKFKTEYGNFQYICTTPETYAHLTITIAGGSVKLPRPEVEAPGEGQEIWLWYHNRTVRDFWSGSGAMQTRLKNGLVHLTENRAQAWADWWQNTVMAAVIESVK